MGDFVFSIKHLCTCTGMSKVRTLTIMGALFLTFMRFITHRDCFHLFLYAKQICTRPYTKCYVYREWRRF